MEQTFESWAIIELFGRTRLAGLVSEKTVAGDGFLQIQVPATKYQPEFSKFIKPSAVYAITPVTEETARYTAEQINTAPIMPWDVRKVVETAKQLGSASPYSSNEYVPDDREDYDDDRD